MSLSISSYPDYSDAAAQPSEATTTTVTCEDRWQVYHRLQELGIACSCGGFQPLRVQVTTPTEAMQLWAVLRRVSLSRKALAASLQQCWQISASR